MQTQTQSSARSNEPSSPCTSEIDPRWIPACVSARDDKDAELGLPEDDITQPLLSKERSFTHDILELGGADIVQFSAPMYYAEESEGMMHVDIIRLGSMQGRIACMLATEDNTATGGLHYENMWEEIVFEDGEHTKTVSIRIDEDDQWDPTVEFKILLTQPKNCVLGLYLYECRVKILNNDPFPTNKYAAEIEKGQEGVGSIDDWGLFIEYCKINFATAGTKWQTVCVLVFDQVANVFLFVSLWVGVYLVDTIFSVSKETSKELLVPNRYHTAVLVSLWYVLPPILIHVWSSVKVYLDIQGTSRGFLQKALVRTYLDTSHKSRQRLSQGELTFAIEDGAEECALGYVAALSVVALAGRIITVALFIVLFQREFLALSCVFALPTILVTITALRAGVSQKAQKKADEEKVHLVCMTTDVCQKIRLVCDYFKRPMMGDMFAKAVNNHNEAQIPAGIVELNTQFATKILSGVAIVIYIVAMAPSVLNHELSLGIFLATISIFGHLEASCLELNAHLILVIKSFTPLKEFTEFLNLSLELACLKKVNRQRRAKTMSWREKLFSTSAPVAKAGEFKSDHIPISMTNVSFEYTPGVPVLKDVTISVEQGSMVAIVGPHGSGKTTFLNLFCNILIPTTGEVYVPSHLRVLHVAREAMFLQMSLLENLVLGCTKKVDIGRVKAILSLLDLEEVIPVLCNIDDATGIPDANACMRWYGKLSHSSIAKLHIVRALIANPEVMILSRPFQAFEGDLSYDILNILAMHVEEKGLCLPDSGRARRRPRDVFYNTESVSQAVQADVIWQMRPELKTVVETTAEALGATKKPHAHPKNYARCRKFYTA